MRRGICDRSDLGDGRATTGDLEINEVRCRGIAVGKHGEINTVQCIGCEYDGLCVGDLGRKVINDPGAGLVHVKLYLIAEKTPT